MSLRKILSYDKLSLIKDRDLPGGGGTQLWVTRHMPPKRPSFLLAFTERPPFLPTFTQWPLFLTNSLSPKDPDTSLSLKDPSFSHLMTSLMKCWKLFGHFGPENPYFLMHFTERPHILCALSQWLKDPFFDTICHRKTPTSEVLGGTSTSLSLCECPRGICL